MYQNLLNYLKLKKLLDVHNAYVFLIFLFSFSLFANPKLNVKGYFLVDSVSIGDRISFVLTLKHDGKSDILVPDSTYDFGEFEYISKQYFDTRSTVKESTDSVVYTFTTFSINPEIKFTLPVFLLLNGDSITYWTQTNKLSLIPAFKVWSDSLKLKTDLSYHSIKKEFNYLKLIVSVILVLSVGIFIWKKWGHYVKKWIDVYRIQQKHASFVIGFDDRVLKFENEKIKENLEEVIFVWKEFLAILLNEPITTFTSREIIQTVQANEDLKKLLNQIDLALYANKLDEINREGFRKLKEQADKIYLQKVS